MKTFKILGTIYLARIVEVGESYGLNNCLVNEDEPLVEIYDTRYDFTEFGQFVSRYYVSTFLDIDSGLTLDTQWPALAYLDVVDVQKFLNKNVGGV
jgi:hypothetical protein